MQPRCVTTWVLKSGTTSSGNKEICGNFAFPHKNIYEKAGFEQVKVQIINNNITKS